jgi:hypothetical protein
LGTGAVELFVPILEESEELGLYCTLPEFKLEEINKLEDMGLCDA